MNILKHFRREAPVEATTDDVLAELEAEEQRQLEARAEQLRRERRSTEEYRAKNRATLADFLKRKDANTTEINRHVVALLLALTDTKKLLAESNSVPFDGSVKSIEEVFGFPYNFPDALNAAIRECAPQTQWDWSATGQPKLKDPQPIRLPQFPASPPVGYSGPFNPATGEPLL